LIIVDEQIDMLQNSYCYGFCVQSRR